ncbi:MAG: hypothetical protein FWD71_10915 [Oscillospiraceae bacterium]|nr:hypothetical protein [Oscillospiraceae bacterium]
MSYNFKRVSLAFALILLLIFPACTAKHLEKVEGIYQPVSSVGYNIQLKRNNIIYSAYATASGVLLADGTKTTLDIPYGKQIGIFTGNEALKNEKFGIYEVMGYSPDEWLYMFYGPAGARGIVLYKANDVTDIPEEFEKLKSEQKK